MSNNGKKNAQVADFLEVLEQFVASLSGAQDNMKGQVTLAETEHGRMLDGMRSPSDYNLAGRLIGINEISVRWHGRRASVGTGEGGANAP